MKKISVYHPIIAPYRIDLFNKISEEFDSNCYLLQSNLYDQTFEYSRIESQLRFKPIYLLRRFGIGKFSIPRGVISSLRKDNPDVVLVSEVGICTLLVLLFKFITLKKYRVVSIVDDSYEMAVNGKQYSIFHKIGEYLLFPFLQNIICVEPRVADYFQKKYGIGIYFPIIADDNKQREKYKESIEISRDYVNRFCLCGKRVLLFVGRLATEKNLPMVIKAFKQANVPDSKFIIVGGGYLEKELSELIGQSENIIMVGRLEHEKLFAWYNIAQVFILPSIMECFGAVTNEALLGGCYSIVSKNAGSFCLIKENFNGTIIDPMDEDNISLVIKNTLQRFPTIDKIDIRKSLMLETFNESITRVISALR